MAEVGHERRVRRERHADSGGAEGSSRSRRPSHACPRALRRSATGRFTPVAPVLAAAAPFFLAAEASAVPPDERLVVAPGTDRFLHARFVVKDVAVEPEGRVQVELLPTEEILLTVPKDAPEGEVLVLAVGVDRIRAFDLCVTGDGDGDAKCPRATDIDAALPACPGLKKGLEDGAPIYEATIASQACLTALRDALAHSDVAPGSLRFTMEEAPAQIFFDRVLQRIQADPKTRGLSAAYYGATLRLKGTVPRQAVNRALIHAYRETVGRVSYDDRTERP